MLDAPLLESVPISEFQDVGEPGAPLVVLLARSVEILETFPCNAIDEILLPASAESVARAMLRAKVEVQRSRVIDLDRRLRHAQATHAIHRPQLRRLAVKDGDRIVLLTTDEVDWIRAAGNYVRVFARGTSYLLRDTMGHVQAMLDPGMFLRVHRNAIVNLDRVQEFIAPADGNMYVVLREGSRVPLSRRYRGDLREVLRNAL
jgi:two-component system LytT family response regulator